MANYSVELYVKAVRWFGWSEKYTKHRIQKLQMDNSLQRLDYLVKQYLINNQ